MRKGRKMRKMEQPEKNKIYIPELLKLLRRQWKLLLLAALVGALILGGIRLVLHGMILSDETKLAKAEDRNILSQEKYEAENLSLEQQIQALRGSIARRQNYLENSVLMQLDPYDHSMGSLLVQIHTGYQIQPGMTYQDPDPTDSVVETYGAAVRSAEFLRVLAAKAELSAVYITELITVTADLDTNSLKVYLRHTDTAVLEQLLQLVASHLEGLADSMAQAHTAQIVNLGIRRNMDMELQKKQLDARAETDALIKSLTDARTRLENLEEPTPRPVTWLQALGHSGLFAILGAVLALVLFCLFDCLYAVGCEKMLSQRMLRDNGFAVLTGSAPQRLAADMKNRCPRGLLVAGDLPAELQEALAKMPDVTLEKDILQDAQSLQALTECCAVVLVVPYGCKLDVLIQQQTLVDDYGKKLIGCVFSDGSR